MHVDDSACNLASLNLMKFRREDGSFDTESFKHAVDIVFLAQEIAVGFSSYPTPEITRNANAFRQLGLGYANLGALLMSNGLPYDSHEGRATAAAITALMTGRGYRKSAEVAAAIGPYDEYGKNREPHNGVMRMHRDAAHEIEGGFGDEELLAAARETWDEAVELGDEHGYRNAQATVLAPTGTISFLMDCDTTGIEPDFSLVKFKELVGGGQMTIVNRTVPMALRTLGYSDSQVDQIEAYINDKATIIGAPELKDEHLPVFDVAVGERAISHMGHIRMMAAAQPFISGAISKTVNLPESATVEDIADAYTEGWKLGLKALAIYRDGSKTAQALRTDSGQADEEPAEEATPAPLRRKMPRERESLTHKFSIAGHEGYITAGKYEDGSVGEIFLTDIGKEGSTLRGMMNAFATAVSIGLQYGVPLEVFVSKFSYMRFDPEGMTQNPEIPFAKSMPDYIARWLASRFIEDVDELEQLGIMTPEVRAKKEAQQALFPTDTAGAATTANGVQRRQRRAKAPERQRRQRRRQRLGGARGSKAVAADRGADRHAAGHPREARGHGPRPGVRPVRRHDAAHGLVLHVLELRQQHRLRLSDKFRPSKGWASHVRGLDGRHIRSSMSGPRRTTAAPSARLVDRRAVRDRLGVLHARAAARLRGARRLGPDGTVFFVGSIFFTSAALLQYLEAANPDASAAAQRQAPANSLRAAPHRWWSAGMQLVGTLFFNRSTFHALQTSLDTAATNRLVWRPDVLGSICFLVSGALAYWAARRQPASLAPAHPRREAGRDQPRRLRAVRHLGDRLVRRPVDRRRARPRGLQRRDLPRRPLLPDRGADAPARERLGRLARPLEPVRRQAAELTGGAAAASASSQVLAVTFVERRCDELGLA